MLAGPWLTGALLAGCDTAPTPPAAPAAVAVTTMQPAHGMLPHLITAYGTAIPAIDGGASLSIPAEGRVTAVHVTPGEHVRTAQALLDFELSAAALSIYQQATTAVALVRDEQQRTRRLVAQQLATQSQQAQADKALSDARATLTALDRDSGGIPRRTLRAPYDGVVSRMPVAPGIRVASGAELIGLLRSDGLVVTVGIESAQRSGVHIGDPVEVTALDGALARLPGRVLRVDRILNSATRLVDVDVAVDGELMQGETFCVDLTVGRWDGWLVPRAAVLEDERGAYVYQVAADKAVRIAVSVAGSDPRSSVIHGPLDPTRELVTVGNYQLTDGARVRLGAAAP